MVCSHALVQIPTLKSPNVPFAKLSLENVTPKSFIRLIAMSAVLLTGTSLGLNVRLLYWIHTNRIKVSVGRKVAFVGT